MRTQGFNPDAIVAHRGWGGFDPEFSSAEAGDASRVQLKNINSLLHLEPADAGIASTHWQADTLPPRFRDRITVV